MLRLSFIEPAALTLLVLLPLFWALAALLPRRATPLRHWLAIGLRSALLIALVGAVAGTQMILPNDQRATIFLVDRSASVAESARAQSEAFLREALSAQRPSDRAAIVVFGGDPLVSQPVDFLAELAPFAQIAANDYTDIGAALELGLALLPADAEKRIVLLSDGGENRGDALLIAQRAALRQIPISVVNLAEQRDALEAAVSRIDLPSRARSGQTVMLYAEVRSNTEQVVVLRLTSGETLIEERSVQLAVGPNSVTFALQPEQAGLQQYDLEVRPRVDARVANNRMSAIVAVEGPPRVLLLANLPEESRAIVGALRAAEMEVDERLPVDAPKSLDELAAYDALMLVNVAARDLPIPLIAAVPTFVRDLGRGLLMIGGDRSFGLGGYQQTAIEEALPVWMEVRDRIDRPDLALVFVIDKSGSMDYCHCNSSDRNSVIMGSGGRGRKLDIAKEAVAQAALLLSPRDTLGVVSFDRAASVTFPATRNSSQDALIGALSAIAPVGTTNVQLGLLEAETMLASVDAPIKHVILLTDGWGEGEGPSATARRMREAGMTLSVVAAGGGSSPELQAIAEAGGGNYYPANDMLDVPQIFVEETVRRVGNYLVERPTLPLRNANSPIVAGITSMPALYGYNGTTIKDSARQILSDPLDGTPLLASWQFGLGRSVAWTSDLSPRWGRELVRWDGFATLVAQTVAWTLPQRDGPSLETEVVLDGNQLRLEVTSDQLAASQQPDRLEATLLIDGELAQPLLMTEHEPGRYRAEVDRLPTGSYQVQLVGYQQDLVVSQASVGVVVPYSAEYGEGNHNSALLSQLSEITGGALISAGPDAFSALAPAAERATPIAMPLLIAALLLLPLDILVRRWRW